MALKNWSFLFKQSAIIALDTMCFIYFFEANPQYGLLVKKIFSYLYNKEIKMITSTITFAEILASSKVFKNSLLVEQHKNALYQIKNLSLIPVDLLIAEKSSIFRVKYNFKLPDAIQLATAYIARATIFITNDEKINKVNEFKILLLKDLL